MLNKEKSVEVIIDKNKCTKCGICIGICHDYLKKGDDGFPLGSNEGSPFGCIQCGNCMMMCPNNAIEIKGEDIDKEHLRELSLNLPDFEAINSLFLKRRSCRKYDEQEVSKEVIDKVLQAAATAAVSMPPSEVKVLVIQGREKVQELADDLTKAMKGFIKMMNPLMLGIIGLMAGKVQYKFLKDFVLPLCRETVGKKDKGIDSLFYNAPVVVMFYSTELTDKDDWILAANQAIIAAESLGLGTCIIGMIGEIFKTNQNLRKKYGISKNDKTGMGFVLGYPVVKFRKGFQRNFKEVRFM